MLVSCNTFRHPALVAKMAATIDHISNGRVEVGLGAAGTCPSTPCTASTSRRRGAGRSRFREAVEIVDSLLRNEVTTYAGHATTSFERGAVPPPADPAPAPAADPRGARPEDAADRGPVRRRLELVRHGRRDAPAQRRPGRAVRRHRPRPDRRSGAVLYGWAALMPADPWQSLDAFADMVGRYREAGVNEFIIDQPAAEQLPMAERIARELLPKLRAPADRRALARSGLADRRIHGSGSEPERTARPSREPRSCGASRGGRWRWPRSRHRSRVNGLSGTSAVPVEMIAPSGKSSSRYRYSTSSSRRPLQTAGAGLALPDHFAVTLDRHPDRQVVRIGDFPGRGDARPNRAGAGVQLRLGQVERVLALDAPRADVVPDACSRRSRRGRSPRSASSGTGTSQVESRRTTTVPSGPTTRRAVAFRKISGRSAVHLRVHVGRAALLHPGLFGPLVGHARRPDLGQAINWRQEHRVALRRPLIATVRSTTARNSASGQSQKLWQRSRPAA